MVLKRLDHLDGFSQFFGGGGFLESGESFGGEKDVFAVAGEHEFLFPDLNAVDPGVCGGEFETGGGEQVFDWGGGLAKAVDPAGAEGFEFFLGNEFGEFFVC